MRFINIVILGIVLCSFLLAQNKVNNLVHKSKKIDPQYEHLIYDYRIPEWGYHRFYLDFSTNINGGKDEYHPDRYENERDNSQYNGMFRPYFYLYRTSEKYIFSINSALNSSYGYYQNRYEYGTTIQKSFDRNFDNYVNLNGNLNQYLGRVFYLNYSTTNSFSYYENRDHTRSIDTDLNITTSSSKNVYIEREYDLNARFGVGLGRIRNVNPVFKALRFNERLKDIGLTNGLSEGDIKSLIYLYAHESAYSSAFDRSKKFFYEALPDRITKQIENLQPWEVLYLDEVSDEIIGNRNEGFEIAGGIQLTHQRAIYTGTSGSGELTLLGFYAQQEYYHNISPSYQIGTNVDLTYSKVLNENTMANFLGRGIATFMNLWNVTDRLLLEFDLGYETGFASIDDYRFSMGALETYDKWHRSDRIRLYLTMDYFLENNLSIGASVSNTANKYWPQDGSSFYYNGYYYGSPYYDREKNWSAQINLRYFFIRGMY